MSQACLVRRCCLGPTELALVSAAALTSEAGGLTAAARATAAGSDLLDARAFRAEWRRLNRAHPPKKVGRDVLELAVAFKLQERVLGGLGASTRRRLFELTGTIEVKGKLAAPRTVRPRPGAKLMREWGGITHEVTVLEDGFSWQGQHWASLSAIAKTITGTHWSGPRFFGLQGRGKRQNGAGQESADA